MSEIQIILSENVTTEQCRAVRLYFENVNQLSSRDWRTALEGFDSLRSSVVCIDGEKFTFEIFYKLFVEQCYTDQFIQRIYNEPNLEQTGRRIQASIAREILHRLSEEELYGRHIVIIKLAAWQFINGDVLPCSFQEAANFLPQTVQVDFEGEGLVVVNYNVWKQKIKSLQRRQWR